MRGNAAVTEESRAGPTVRPALSGLSARPDARELPHSPDLTDASVVPDEPSLSDEPVLPGRVRPVPGP